MLLSKKTYREVVKNLEYYRKQHEQDRTENPNMIPMGWGITLQQMIESVVRKNHERCYKGLAGQVLEYLVKQKLLVPYVGDYTFPTNESLPTEEDIRKEAENIIKSFDSI